MFSKKSAKTIPNEAARTPARRVGSNSTFSVIGADVTITGNIAASADLHVDGVIEGDLACTSLVQGDTSRIEGAISAETARLAGTVRGSVTVRELVILKTARIDGDVHYDALTIEHGAKVTGRFAPAGTSPCAQLLGVGDEQRLSLAG